MVRFPDSLRHNIRVILDTATAQKLRAASRSSHRRGRHDQAETLADAAADAAVEARTRREELDHYLHENGDE
jgi:hypothetical protein